ncbi:hypothetical protein HMPREF0454_00581 [Hafnia alvei ATCC 51873]|uniref:Uncharacterized protein n=1 Tax=Hafnia alvei ATCC 51873 TaxID=1002364 RepID=G9Y1X0_HAFAL|nr:hypothetical protein HMPREF0454_00581 [Hafnia alvei ATCC 51873]
MGPICYFRHNLTAEFKINPQSPHSLHNCLFFDFSPFINLLSV